MSSQKTEPLSPNCYATLFLCCSKVVTYFKVKPQSRFWVNFKVHVDCISHKIYQPNDLIDFVHVLLVLTNATLFAFLLHSCCHTLAHIKVR